MPGLDGIGMLTTTCAVLLAIVQFRFSLVGTVNSACAGNGIAVIPERLPVPDDVV